MTTYISQLKGSIQQNEQDVSYLRCQVDDAGFSCTLGIGTEISRNGSNDSDLEEKRQMKRLSDHPQSSININAYTLEKKENASGVHRDYDYFSWQVKHSTVL
jgi:hypothetical protein